MLRHLPRAMQQWLTAAAPLFQSLPCVAVLVTGAAQHAERAHPELPVCTVWPGRRDRITPPVVHAPPPAAPHNTLTSTRKPPGARYSEVATDAVRLQPQAQAYDQRNTFSSADCERACPLPQLAVKVLQLMSPAVPS